MDKQQLRTRQRALTQALSGATRAAADAAIRAHVLALPEYRRAKRVFFFVSTRQEVDTHPLVKQALAEGKQVCVPRCLPGGQMALCRISDLDALRPGAYGILEPNADCPRVAPETVEFALIPCVACTRRGDRLGQGGGYYDRFLPGYPGAAALVCREALLLDWIPTEAHDRAIPLVITEKGVFLGGKKR